MTHLTDEQLEAVLHGWAPEADHLAECPQCRARLEERRAIRARLRGAFSSIHADQALTDSIRGALGEAEAQPAPREERRPSGIYRILVPSLAAAAVLIVGIPVIIFLTRSTPARAAEAELHKIHQHGLSPHTDLYADAKPEELARYLRDKLGFTPALPRLGAGMSLRGCCVSHFRKKPAGSYVVDTDRGVISVIVLKEKADVVGLKEQIRHRGRTYDAGSYAKCQMVSLELGGYTYCAVGEVSRAFLADLLRELVPADQP